MQGAASTQTTIEKIVRYVLWYAAALIVTNAVAFGIIFGSGGMYEAIAGESAHYWYRAIGNTLYLEDVLQHLPYVNNGMVSMLCICVLPLGYTLMLIDVNRAQRIKRLMVCSCIHTLVLFVTAYDILSD